MSVTKAQLWGELRSILHGSSTGCAEAVSDVLTKWHDNVMQDLELLHYMFEFRPEWVPSSHSPPPYLLELWLRGKALKLYELLCSVPPLSFKKPESNVAFEELVSFFDELSPQDEFDIFLEPMTKAQVQRAWTWASHRGELMPHSRTAWHPTMGETELAQLDNVIEEVFTDHGQESFHPLVQFDDLRADARFAHMPELSLWFFNGQMELTFWGGSGCSAQQLVSLFEMLWMFIQDDVPVPSFEWGTPHFEPCWQRFVVLRKGWDSVTQ